MPERAANLKLLALALRAGVIVLTACFRLRVTLSSLDTRQLARGALVSGMLFVIERM